MPDKIPDIRPSESPSETTIAASQPWKAGVIKLSDKVPRRADPPVCRARTMMPFSFAAEISASVRASSWSASIPAAPSPLEDPPTARIRVLQSSGRSAPVCSYSLLLQCQPLCKVYLQCLHQHSVQYWIRIAGVRAHTCADLSQFSCSTCWPL